MAATSAVRAGRAYVELITDDSKLGQGLRRAQQKLQSFGAIIDKAGLKMMAVGAGILAPLALSVRAASRAEETFSKFATVFGQNAAAVRKWGDATAKEVGRSQQEVASFLASSQDLFVPLGFDSASAEQMSKQITRLAIDLASFNNITDDTALESLQAALTGSGETVKKFGVILNEARVNADLLNRAIDPSKATDQEKVFSRLNIILRGTTAAQGDAIRTSDSFANSMKRLRGMVDDAAVSIGTALLPALSNVLQQLMPTIKAIGDWAAINAVLVVDVAKLGVGLLALGTAARGVAAVTAAFAGLRVAVVALAASPALGAITILSAATIALAGIFRLAGDAVAEMDTTMKELLDSTDQQRISDVAAMRRLEQLAAKEKLNNTEMEEADGLIIKLTKAYGDLGFGLDLTTGRITGVTEAMSMMNAAMQKSARLSTEAAAYEQLHNLTVALEALDEARAQFTGAGRQSPIGDLIFGDSKVAFTKIKDAMDRVEVESKKLESLKARLDAIDLWNAPSFTGEAAAAPGTTSTAATSTPAVSSAAEEASAKYLQLIQDEMDASGNAEEQEIAGIRRARDEKLAAIDEILRAEKGNADAVAGWTAERARVESSALAQITAVQQKGAADRQRLQQEAVAGQKEYILALMRTLSELNGDTAAVKTLDRAIYKLGENAKIADLFKVPEGSSAAVAASINRNRDLAQGISDKIAGGMGQAQQRARDIEVRGFQSSAALNLQGFGSSAVERTAVASEKSVDIQKRILSTLENNAAEFTE